MKFAMVRPLSTIESRPNCKNLSRPRRLYAKQTECQADWMPSILCFYTRFCQFVRLIIGLIISLFARYTKGRGKNSRFFQTFAKMWFFFYFWWDFDLDQGGAREICRFSESHRRFSSLPLFSAQVPRITSRLWMSSYKYEISWNWNIEVTIVWYSKFYFAFKSTSYALVLTLIISNFK